MAKRNLQANITIGATLAASVASAFGGLQSKMAALKADTAKLAATRKDVEAFSRALGKQEAARARLNAARKGGVAGDIAKARTAFEKQTASVEKLRAALKAAGVDTRNLSHENERLAHSIERIGGKIGNIRRISDTFTALRAKVQGVGAAFSGVGASLGNMRNTLVGAGLGLGAVGYGFKSQFVDRAAAFEKYRIQLAAFGDDAEKALAWSEQFAMETPLNLDQVVQAYVKLRQQGLDPTDGTLQALTDGVAKVGGEFYDLEEIISQLGQAWRKSKLTSEDVKPLMNRGIPVYDMLVKSGIGKNAQEIMEMQADGKLGRKAIGALLFELGRWSKGMSKQMAGTWTGILGRMGDYWVKFTKLVMESGPFSYMKAELEKALVIVDRLEKDGTLKRWAEETGAAILKFFEGVTAFSAKLWTAVTAVKDFVGGWENLGIVVAAIPFAGLIASVVQLTAALTQLGIAAGAALGPWGLLVAGLTAAAVWMWNNQEAIQSFIEDTPILRGAIDSIATALVWVETTWKSIVDAIERGGTMWVNMFNSIMQKVDALFAKLKSLTQISIGGFTLGDIGGTALDINPLTAPARLAQRSIQSLMPSSKMPVPQTSNAAMKQDLQINVTVPPFANPATAGRIIGEQIGTALKPTTLYDTTGALTPK